MLFIDTGASGHQALFWRRTDGSAPVRISEGTIRVESPHLPDLQAAALARAEIDPSPIPRPAGARIFSRFRCEPVVLASIGADVDVAVTALHGVEGALPEPVDNRVSLRTGDEQADTKQEGGSGRTYSHGCL